MYETNKNWLKPADIILYALILVLTVMGIMGRGRYLDSSNYRMFYYFVPVAVIFLLYTIWYAIVDKK